MSCIHGENNKIKLRRYTETGVFTALVVATTAELAHYRVQTQAVFFTAYSLSNSATVPLL
ncbi:hypothetical protein GCM10027514_36380 [Azotobacter armeniacus]